MQCCTGVTGPAWTPMNYSVLILDSIRRNGLVHAKDILPSIHPDSPCRCHTSAVLFKTIPWPPLEAASSRCLWLCSRGLLVSRESCESAHTSRSIPSLSRTKHIARCCTRTCSHKAAQRRSYRIPVAIQPRISAKKEKKMKKVFDELFEIEIGNNFPRGVS